jgi:pimeloyl-ACP methyl ester carboxylesterase
MNTALLLEHLSVPVVAYAVLNLLAGMMGMVVYGALSYTFGPVYVMNQFIGLWLTSLLVFFSLLTIWHYCTIRFMPSNQTWMRFTSIGFNIIYFAVIILEMVLLFIGFVMGKRIDAIIWALLLVVLNCGNLFSIIWNYRIRELDVRDKAGFVNTNSINSPQEESSEKANTIVHYVFASVVLISKILSVVIIALLINGAFTLGAGVVRYPPRGKFVTVSLDDGRSQTIHYLCDGPENSSFPVYMFEADGTHGLADFLGLQTLLRMNERRSCIWDKPGLGYSDYLYVNQNSDQTYYHNFITAMGEQGPFIFVGWGGGGQIIYEYAAKHPEMVHSLVMLDVASDRVEWTIPSILNNFTDAQYNAYMNADLQSRYVLYSLINGLGVPWGLMGAIMNPSNFDWPPELKQERYWYMLTEKTWSTQLHWLRLFPTKSNAFLLAVNSSIPVNLIITSWNDTQVINDQCIKQGIAVTSDACNYAVKANRMMTDFKIKLVPLNGGSISYCTDSVCDLGYYVFGKPDYTIAMLNKIYENTTLAR